MPKKFPLFIDLTEKKVVVYGAGVIASRRVETLLAFTSSLTVFAPEASERVQRAAEEGYLVWKREAYQEGTIPADAFMVLAATNDDELHARICRDGRAAGAFVNNASDHEQCDFYFPSIVRDEQKVIGLNGGGMDHRGTKELRKKVEQVLEIGADKSVYDGE